jgi:hypothetical protein
MLGEEKEGREKTTVNNIKGITFCSDRSDKHNVSIQL